MLSGIDFLDIYANGLEQNGFHIDVFCSDEHLTLHSIEKKGGEYGMAISHSVSISRAY